MSSSNQTLSPGRTRKRVCARHNGTAATTGQPGARRSRAGRTTTCALSAVVDARIEAARLWVTPSGKAQHKKDFIEAAVNTAVQALLVLNPDFKLPPSCAFGP